jgi:phage terminase small subunit
MASPKRRSLSPRQKRFVAEYLVDLNATQAAIRAGYSARTAEQQGPRLLGNVGIAAALQEARVKLQIRTDITQDRVLAELALLAFSDVSHFQVNDAGHLQLAPHAPLAAMRSVSSIKRSVTVDKQGGVTRDVEIKLWDKPGPLKLAGRHVGLFPDRVEVTGKDGGPVKTQQVTRDEAIEALRAVMPAALREAPAADPAPAPTILTEE